MSIKYNLRNRQILKKVDGKYIKAETRNHLYKICKEYTYQAICNKLANLKQKNL